MRLDGNLVYQADHECEDIQCRVINENEIDHVTVAWRSMGPCCFITTDPFDFKEVYGSLKSCGLQVSFVNSDFFVKYLHELMLTNWSVIFICVDDFGGVGEIFEELRSLRIGYPHVGIVLMSKNFNSSDFSQERLAICDISLRLPYLPEEFPHTITCTFSNNEAWKVRIEELSKIPQRSSVLQVKNRRRMNNIFS